MHIDAATVRYFLGRGRAVFSGHETRPKAFDLAGIALGQSPSQKCELNHHSTLTSVIERRQVVDSLGT